MSSFEPPPRTNEDRTYLFGYSLLCLTFCFFVTSSYMLVISKFMPYTGHAVLDWVKDDYYYCILFPLTIPVSVVFVYLNWTSLKFFRHN